MIREIHPSIPDECRVAGFIVCSDNKLQLSEDMLDIMLPNGLLVTAGWYPDGGEQGRYRVCIHRGYDELIPPLESDDADKAAAAVEMLVRQFLAEQASVPAEASNNSN